MISMSIRTPTELDKRLCPKYVIFCATFSAIFSTEGMPTNLPATIEPSYVTTQLDTNVTFEDPICRSMAKSPNSSSFLCRPRVDKCDVPEYCSTDGSCPPNVHLADRTPCDFNDGICYQGVCYLTNSPCGVFLAHTFPSESVTSRSNDSFVVIPPPVVCNTREICVDGQCLPIGKMKTDTCPSSVDGRKCSGHGYCTNYNECVCKCGWVGLACELSRNESHDDKAITDQSAWCLPDEGNNDVTGIASPSEESRSTVPGGVSDENDIDEMASASLMANAIIGGSIALMFAVAVIFGATSIGFRKARKKDRLRTLHQFRIMSSIFQPTKAQQRKLMKQDRPRYTNPYRERRNDVTKNKDQRIILEPDSNNRSHGNNKAKGFHKARPGKIKKGNVMKLSETMV